ncbi:hypothetical protein JZU46_02460 [bacterium]|nr:hypothetical protein [bacterium]
MTIRYRQALIYALTTPVNGICWTSTAIQLDPEFDVTNDDSAFLWNQVAAACARPTKELTANRVARLLRINIVHNTCDVKTLREAVENMETLFELQCQIGVPLPPIPKLYSTQFTRSLIRSAIPWETSDPDFEVGQSGSFFGYSKLHPTTLNNSLTLGGTGSGKSCSVIIPLLKALLRYQLHDGTLASMLIVDPKRELDSVVRTVLTERGELHRLIVIGESAPVPIFSADSPLSMSDRLEKLQNFGPIDQPNGDHGYWKNLGQCVILDMMQLENEFAKNTHGKRLTSLLCKELRIHHTENCGYWQQLRALLAYTRTGRARLKEADVMLRLMCSQARIQSRSSDVMLVYTGDDELLRQWCYAVQSAEPLVNALANPDIEKFVDLDPIQNNQSSHTNIADLIENGMVILFSPESTEGHRIAAMALKQKFFESVFSRKNLLRPIGVVIDEAQQFITSDKETGEQSFLDRCRAYRCIVALATQSISSLKYALGSNAAAQTAIDIVTANTPSKFILRTTDVDTVNWLRSQLPQSTDGNPHIIDVRRPISLRPGEAYFMLADGSWGRRRASIVQRTSSVFTGTAVAKGPK